MDRRDRRLLLISALLGPLVGLALFVVGAAVGYGRQYGMSEGFASLLLPIAFLPLAIVGAYLMGAIPALIGALVIVVLGRWFPQRRLLLAAPVGAVSTLPLYLWLSGSMPPDLAGPGGIFLAIVGAVSALLCVAIADRTSSLSKAGP